MATTKDERLKNRGLRASMDREVDDELAKLGLQLNKIRRASKKLQDEMDGFSKFIDTMNGFQRHRTVAVKLMALKRLVAATKIGMERNSMRLYDIDTNLVRDEVLQRMGQ